MSYRDPKAKCPHRNEWASCRSCRLDNANGRIVELEASLASVVARRDEYQRAYQEAMNKEAADLAALRSRSDGEGAEAMTSRISELEAQLAAVLTRATEAERQRDEARRLVRDVAREDEATISALRSRCDALEAQAGAMRAWFEKHFVAEGYESEDADPETAPLVNICAVCNAVAKSGALEHIAPCPLAGTPVFARALLDERDRLREALERIKEHSSPQPSFDADRPEHFDEDAARADFEAIHEIATAALSNAPSSRDERLERAERALARARDFRVVCPSCSAVFPLIADPDEEARAALAPEAGTQKEGEN